MSESPNNLHRYLCLKQEIMQQKNVNSEIPTDY